MTPPVDAGGTAGLEWTVQPGPVAGLIHPDRVVAASIGGQLWPFVGVALVFVLVTFLWARHAGRREQPDDRAPRESDAAGATEPEGAAGPGSASEGERGPERKQAFEPRDRRGIGSDPVPDGSDPLSDGSDGSGPSVDPAPDPAADPEHAEHRPDGDCR